MRGSSKNKIVKRLQVPKACLNCRKMHTGCDTVRPCKRCVQHGIGHLCVDLTRRKRSREEDDVYDDESLEDIGLEEIGLSSGNVEVMKKLRKRQTKSVQLDDPEELIEDLVKSEGRQFNLYDFSQSQNPIVLSSPERSPTIEMDSFAPDQKLWVPHYEDIVSNLETKEILKDFKHPADAALPFGDWGFKSLADHQAKEFAKDFGSFDIMSDLSAFSNEDPILAQALNPILPRPSAPAVLTPSAVMTNPAALLANFDGAMANSSHASLSNVELNLLISQISELKESNKALEKNLMTVASEFTEPAPKPAPRPASHNANSLVLWTSVSGDGKTPAISTWKTSFEGTFLSECNEKFVETVGYPFSMLRSNFSLSALFPGVPLLESDPSQWPQKVKVCSASGPKDVLVSVSPVLGDSKSVLVQMADA
eukprot:TRINITY_DN3632_c0_g1_i2.p1 TRINITY_DN3632_c0_g1~~TRINITY_DN3632_c0_g1_i2.p1  ORF type:complete len:423 (+),score=97.58 TRINITY_DN3632_c0_g1_i2:98-1366(+)